MPSTNVTVSTWLIGIRSRITPNVDKPYSNVQWINVSVRAQFTDRAQFRARAPYTSYP